jgi:methionyl-tRNA formyltransferase
MVEDDREEPAGLLRAGDDGVPIVTTGTGGVGLLEVGPEGRSRMPGAAWLRGARLASGERLG